jgi:hypothetical protein
LSRIVALRLRGKPSVVDLDIIEALFGKRHIEPGVEADHRIILTAGDLLASGVINADHRVDGGAGAPGVHFEHAALARFDLQAEDVAVRTHQRAVQGQRRRRKRLRFQANRSAAGARRGGSPLRSTPERHPR